MGRAIVPATARRRPSGAPPVGQECHVFGGTKVDRNFGLRYTSFFYIFRVGRAVVKLYAAEGDMAAQHGRSLTPRHMTPIAERISSRIASEMACR